MTDVLIQFTPSATLRRARTLRELAKSRHIEAVRALECGKRELFVSMLRDVDALEEEARRIERHADRVEECRRATGEAIARVIRKVSA
jgi:hypothetical protein